jgi:hypothetical protein
MVDGSGWWVTKGVPQPSSVVCQQSNDDIASISYSSFFSVLAAYTIPSDRPLAFTLFPLCRSSYSQGIFFLSRRKLPLCRKNYCRTIPAKSGGRGLTAHPRSTLRKTFRKCVGKME